MLKKTILYLAMLWTALIAVLCLVKFSNLPTFGVKGTDKYVHFTFHFVFTLIWGYYFFIKKTTIRIKTIFIIVVVSFFYGIIIEFIQETCTTTRHADVLDVLANTCGTLSTFLIFIAFDFINSKKQ